MPGWGLHGWGQTFLTDELYPNELLTATLVYGAVSINPDEWETGGGGGPDAAWLVAHGLTPTP